ncbi:GNAT family N-acetyltransferase [uncultured Nocardioides sp.]|uniref:GNAT family N-acetyltransferase n=1 Tax=uncultured Nocardioides sp. TaxID=198441 RepID=UPI002613C830|nr:GNAT family N-acetyltransferase [uncultured Nocardioides sp.]
MLWRIRTSLPDRPGALAALARACGEAGVNVLGLQIFPGVVTVTDELVVRTPAGWGGDDLARLVVGAGGQAVAVSVCSESALVDQPARYLRAARSVLASPASFTEVLADLFDAGAGPEPGPGPEGGPGADVMEMRVVDVVVQVWRRTPFTATEHARGAALADLLADVLADDRSALLAPTAVPGGPTALEVTVRATGSGGVEAVAGGGVVGAATLDGPTPDGVMMLRLHVEAGWRRRGVGTRLLLGAVREAGAAGASEVLLETEAGNQAVLPMVLAAGLRGRIRVSGGRLAVHVPARALAPRGVRTA